MMVRRPIIRKLNLNVNGALSFWGLVGGVDNQKIGGDNKSVLKELKITCLGKWKVTGKQLGQCRSKG